MWILLLLPYIGLLWVPFYNFTDPRRPSWRWQAPSLRANDRS